MKLRLSCTNPSISMLEISIWNVHTLQLCIGFTDSSLHQPGRLNFVSQEYARKCISVRHFASALRLTDARSSMPKVKQSKSKWDTAVVNLSSVIHFNWVRCELLIKPTLNIRHVKLHLYGQFQRKHEFHMSYWAQICVTKCNQRG